jgi:tocopherol O-methyltransferase
VTSRRLKIRAIREHYDHLSVFYRLLWGAHIHHGYWEGDESPAVAQVQLTARLVDFAAVPRGARVLDVGCGLGGSALWLARHRDCQVTAITLSPVQVWMATRQARAEGLGERVQFRRHDANHLTLPQSFDVVWVVECSEHLEDKKGFIASCARLLDPGGRIALCAWVASGDPDCAEHSQLVEEVCHGMLCPSLARAAEYTNWLQASGFEAMKTEDITCRVSQTWTFCERIAARPIVRLGQLLLGRRTRDFVQSFGTIQRAYAEGAMAYWMFTAKKPA